jgi:hypothetical protein
LPVARRFAKDFRVTPENRPSLAALAARVTGDPLPLPVRTVTRVVAIDPSHDLSRGLRALRDHADKSHTVGPVELGWPQEAWRGWADECAVVARLQSRLGRVAVELISATIKPKRVQGLGSTLDGE